MGGPERGGVHAFRLFDIEADPAEARAREVVEDLVGGRQAVGGQDRQAVERENRATRPGQAAVQRKKIDLRPIQSYCKYRYCKGLVEDRVAFGVDRVDARVVSFKYDCFGRTCI